MKAVLIATVLLSGAQSNHSSPTPTTCALAVHVAIACAESADAPANAAALYTSYRFDRVRLEADYTRAYLNQYGCAVIHDGADATPIKLTVMRRGRVADDQGWHNVARVAVMRPQRAAIAWIADEYMTKSCPTVGDTAPVDHF